MNISGIRPYADFYNQNSIKPAEICSKMLTVERPLAHEDHSVQTRRQSSIPDEDKMLQQYLYFIGSSAAKQRASVPVRRSGERFIL